MSSPMSQVSLTPPFPPFPFSQSPLPIAVCATTLLYDYALTFGEEVRINRPPLLTEPPDRLICFRRSQECGRQLPPILTPARSTLTPHSLRLSIPKSLFLINRYVVLPMLVCVSDYSPRLSTSLIQFQFQRDRQVYYQSTPNLCHSQPSP